MNLNKEILRLSLPSIFSNITIPLLGLTDTVITGHLGSSLYIAAVSIGTLMFNTVFWLFGFLRMGTTGLTAQAYGASDETGCRDVLSRAFFLALSLGVLLVVMQLPMQWLLLKIIEPEEALRGMAVDYFTVCIWASPALLATMALSGWMIGMQNTAWPMVVAIVTNVINIVLSVLFVFPLRMGFIGVAYGSLVANWFGLAFALFAARRVSGAPLRLSPRRLLSKGGLSRFFSVNVDIFLRSGCMLTVSMACGALGARMGALVVAANAVLMNFFHFFSYFMDGFAFAGEALTGRFAGEGNRPMLMKSVKYLLVWGGGCAAVFFAVYFFGTDAIVALITDNADVIGYASTLKIFIVLLPPLTVLAFMMDGFFIGLTATRSMLVATAVSCVAFFAVVFIHPSASGLWGMPDNRLLWIGFLVYLFLRGLLLSLRAPYAFKIKPQ